MIKTIILGASENTTRFSNKAVKSLTRNNFDVIAIGNKIGKIDNIEIISHIPNEKNIHTISIYLSKENQEIYYDFILNSNAKRVIFNPGSENEQLKVKCIENGIQVVEDCTIMMANNGRF